MSTVKRLPAFEGKVEKEVCKKSRTGVTATVLQELHRPGFSGSGWECPAGVHTLKLHWRVTFPSTTSLQTPFCRSPPPSVHWPSTGQNSSSSKLSSSPEYRPSLFVKLVWGNLTPMDHWAGVASYGHQYGQGHSPEATAVSPGSALRHLCDAPHLSRTTFTLKVSILSLKQFLPPFPPPQGAPRSWHHRMKAHISALQ